MTVQELDRYRPIPYGGVNLLAIVLLPVFFYGLTRWILGIQTGVETPQLIVAIFPLLTAVLSFVAGVVIHMKVDAEVSPIQWLLRYWERNIVGYSLWVHRCVGGKLAFRFDERRFDYPREIGVQEQCRICHSKCFLVLPLGGWRSKWGHVEDEEHVRYLDRRQVRLLAYDQGKVWMKLQTGTDQLVMYANTALQFLSVHPRHNETFGGRVELLLAHDAAATRRGKETLGVIDVAIAKIMATDRLRCTKEGKRLKKWLEEERDELLKVDSPAGQPEAVAVAAATS